MVGFETDGCASIASFPMSEADLSAFDNHLDTEDGDDHTDSSMNFDDVFEVLHSAQPKVTEQFQCSLKNFVGTSGNNNNNVASAHQSVSLRSGNGSTTRMLMMNPALNRSNEKLQMHTPHPMTPLTTVSKTRVFPRDQFSKFSKSVGDLSNVFEYDEASQTTCSFNLAEEDGCWWDTNTSPRAPVGANKGGGGEGKTKPTKKNIKRSKSKRSNTNSTNNKKNESKLSSHTTSSSSSNTTTSSSSSATRTMSLAEKLMDDVARSQHELNDPEHADEWPEGLSPCSPKSFLTSSTKGTATTVMSSFSTSLSNDASSGGLVRVQQVSPYHSNWKLPLSTNNSSSTSASSKSGGSAGTEQHQQQQQQPSPLLPKMPLGLGTTNASNNHLKNNDNNSSNKLQLLPKDSLACYSANTAAATATSCSSGTTVDTTEAQIKPQNNNNDNHPETAPAVPSLSSSKASMAVSAVASLFVPSSFFKHGHDSGKSKLTLQPPEQQQEPPEPPPPQSLDDLDYEDCDIPVLSTAKVPTGKLSVSSTTSFSTPLFSIGGDDDELDEDDDNRTTTTTTTKQQTDDKKQQHPDVTKTRTTTKKGSTPKLSLTSRKTPQRTGGGGSSAPSDGSGSSSRKSANNNNRELHSLLDNISRKSITEIVHRGSGGASADGSVTSFWKSVTSVNTKETVESHESKISRASTGSSSATPRKQRRPPSRSRPNPAASADNNNNNNKTEKSTTAGTDDNVRRSSAPSPRTPSRGRKSVSSAQPDLPSSHQHSNSNYNHNDSLTITREEKPTTSMAPPPPPPPPPSAPTPKGPASPKNKKKIKVRASDLNGISAQAVKNTLKDSKDFETTVELLELAVRKWKNSPEGMAASGTFNASRSSLARGSIRLSAKEVTYGKNKESGGGKGGDREERLAVQRARSRSEPRQQCSLSKSRIISDSTDFNDHPDDEKSLMASVNTNEIKSPTKSSARTTVGTPHETKSQRRGRSIGRKPTTSSVIVSEKILDRVQTPSRRHLRGRTPGTDTPHRASLDDSLQSVPFTVNGSVVDSACPSSPSSPRSRKAPQRQRSNVPLVPASVRDVSPSRRPRPSGSAPRPASPRRSDSKSPPPRKKSSRGSLGKSGPAHHSSSQSHIEAPPLNEPSPDQSDQPCPTPKAKGQSSRSPSPTAAATGTPSSCSRSPSAERDKAISKSPTRERPKASLSPKPARRGKSRSPSPGHRRASKSPPPTSGGRRKSRSPSPGRRRKSRSPSPGGGRKASRSPTRRSESKERRPTAPPNVVDPPKTDRRASRSTGRWEGMRSLSPLKNMRNLFQKSPDSSPVKVVQHLQVTSPQIQVTSPETQASPSPKQSTPQKRRFRSKSSSPVVISSSVASVRAVTRAEAAAANASPRRQSDMFPLPPMAAEALRDNNNKSFSRFFPSFGGGGGVGGDGASVISADIGSIELTAADNMNFRNRDLKFDAELRQKIRDAGVTDEIYESLNKAGLMILERPMW